MKDKFKQQLDRYQPIPQDVYDNIEFKVVWSGEVINIGDKVVYAFIFDPNDNKLKLASFVDRELTKLDAIFDFLDYHNEIIPILKYKTDNKNHL